MSARNLVPTKKKSCLPFTSKSYSKFGTDVNIQGTVLSDGLIVDGWRHKGNSSNAPPGSAPCDSCGRFQTRLDAHQAGVHWLMALPLFHVLLSLAIEAWNSAIKFTLKGPNDELLTSAQQRDYADWLYKIVGKFLVDDQGVCILLLYLYEIAYGDANGEGFPGLFSSNFGHEVFFGVSSAFTHLLPEVNEAWSSIQLSPQPDAVRSVFRIRFAKVRAGRRAVVDDKASRDAAVAAGAATTERLREESQKRYDEAGVEKEKAATVERAEKKRNREQRAWGLKSAKLAMQLENSGTNW